MTTGTQYDPENRKKEIVLQHPEICVVYGRLCVSQCLSFSLWKAVASASCQRELMEILLQLRKSQATPYRELGLRCSHLPFPHFGEVSDFPC